MTKLTALLTMLGVDLGSLDSGKTRDLYNAFMIVEDTKNALETYGQSLRAELFNTIEKEGIWDEKGSCMVTFPDGKWVKREARTSVSLNVDRAKILGDLKNIPLVKHVPQIAEGSMEEAVEFLCQHNPSVVVFTEKVDEDKVEQAYINQLINDAELAGILEKKVNYALKKSK